MLVNGNCLFQFNEEFSEEHKIQLPRLQSSEIKFFQLVADNDADGLQNFLQDHSKLNINCINFQVNFVC